VDIPEGRLSNVIDVYYRWEPVSESAKTTKATTMHIGNAVAAGAAFFTSLHVNTLSPGEQIPFQDKIEQFAPFAPGDYRLHVELFSRYSTERNRPVQELLRDFTVVP
jgi:hypothetical protein